MDEKLPSYQLMATPSSSTSKGSLRTCSTFSLAASILFLACTTLYSTHYALLQGPHAGRLFANNPELATKNNLCPSITHEHVFAGAPKAGSSSDTNSTSDISKPSQSSLVSQLGSRAEALNVTSWNWKNLAESVLCSDGSAAKIRDAEHSFLPNNDFFVLVTKPGWGNSNWGVTDGEHFEDDSKCGHDMWVFMLPPPNSATCTTTEVRWANYIINEAVRLHSHPEDIRKAISTGMAGMQLNYHFIATWNPSGLQSWADWVSQSCVVKNKKALVYLKP